MAKPSESTKTSLRQWLAARARERWPQLDGITVRYHGEFACVAGQLPGGTGEIDPAQRLHDRHLQEALDCACGLCLGDTTAWIDPPSPTN